MELFTYSKLFNSITSFSPSCWVICLWLVSFSSSPFSVPYKLFEVLQVKIVQYSTCTLSPSILIFHSTLVQHVSVGFLESKLGIDYFLITWKNRLYIKLVSFQVLIIKSSYTSHWTIFLSFKTHFLSFFSLMVNPLMTSSGSLFLLIYVIFHPISLVLSSFSLSSCLNHLYLNYQGT